MKNIAIFIPTIKSGGAEKQATLLAQILAPDYNVHFISFYGTQNASEQNLHRLQTSKVQIHFLKGGKILKLVSLYKILKENNINYVFNYLTFCDVIGAYIEKLAGVNYIYNGIRNSRLPFLKYFFEKIAHNYLVTGTIFNCYSGAEYFRDRGFKKEKNIVISNCYSPISNSFRRNEKQIKRIITVGRFVEQKDYFTALKVISKLKDKRKDFKFDIVGYGALETQIRSWITQLNISDVINIHINPTNVPDLLQEADIYLSTSLFEGTSNSIMEAMNYSLPIVATNVGDNNYLIKNGETGFLTSIADVENILKSILSLLDDYDLRIKMGEMGNKKLQSEFSHSIFKAKYQSLIK